MINPARRVAVIDSELVARHGFAIIDRYSRRCRPRVLVVTDANLSFNAAAAFGLTRFLEAITLGVGITVKPLLTLAYRNAGHPTPIAIGPDSYPVLSNYNFAAGAAAVSLASYDQVWMFGFDGGASLSAPELAAMATFMNGGGGVFSTGDHASLGAAMGRDLPRVRHMREWSGIPMGTEGVPAALERIDTVVDPGANGLAEFWLDQADLIPQRIYPNYTVVSGTPAGPNVPNWRASLHPLLSMPGAPAIRMTTNDFTLDIDCLPDHQHESICYAVDNALALNPALKLEGAVHYQVSAADAAAKLAGNYTLVAPNFEEFRPAVTGGGRTGSAIVAFATSGGKTTYLSMWKPPVRPRMFGVVAAYDGRLAQAYPGNSQPPGRIVTDSTWHHFVNVNVDGTGSGGNTGLGTGVGAAFVPGPHLVKIMTYWRNIIAWLQPANRIWCRLWWHLEAIRLHPAILEEIATVKLDRFDDLVALGTEARALLAGAIGAAQADDLLVGALGIAPETAALAAFVDGPDILATDLDRERLLGGVLGVMLAALGQDDDGQPERSQKRFEAGPEKLMQAALGKLPGLIGEALAGSEARAAASAKFGKALLRSRPQPR